ncbi:aldose epimerase family protein [Butyrivibrio sp. YAB3001]|uniref:aldose epimerase family protein n=1 Tax=Butyrivibrio sp. YAB3001 TaxID=1520812 RepID=UPI0008F61FB3|nr:aldose epimerase family protein [Butyrivibrio sp. YAB3001]SFB95983.1 aldose 1-epimerase [Butyrivibrio sp. YAB3001]
MAVTKELLGKTKDGQSIFAFHLNNNCGMEAVVLNYGCTIKNIFVPTSDGKRVDVVLGFDEAENYFDNDCFLGSTVGPSANRIANAKYTIDGKEFTLPVNDGPNNLHTDFNDGFHKRIWEAKEGENSVEFTLESKDGDLGFSGNRVFTLKYTLDDDNNLELHYHAKSDAKTLINMTNHVYFNLGGQDSGSILDHTLELNASKFTPVIDSAAIPTGELQDVAGTVFDFTKGKTIGQDIEVDDKQLQCVGGYDHNFCVDGEEGTLRQAAFAKSPKTGITLKCSTTLPGVQLYVGNFLKSNCGKNNTEYKARDGFCLETQYYPNSINQEGFPDAVFGPERDYDCVTVYQFK